MGGWGGGMVRLYPSFSFVPPKTGVNASRIFTFRCGSVSVTVLVFYCVAESMERINPTWEWFLPRLYH